MKYFKRNILHNYNEIYKLFLFIVSILLLVWLFPREATFKYEFKTGKYWMHEDLIAPYDFPILKTQKELLEEKQQKTKNALLYFIFDTKLTNDKKNQFKENLKNSNIEISDYLNNTIYQIIDSVFEKGIIEINNVIENKPSDYEIIYIKNNLAEKKTLENFYTIPQAYNYIKSKIKSLKLSNENQLISLIESSLIQNVKYDLTLTDKAINEIVSEISPAKGLIEQGQLIISKGELITPEKSQILESLKFDYERKNESNISYFIVLIGQIILLTASLLALYIFLKEFLKDILADNKKVILILIVISAMVLLTSILIKTSPQYIYILPFCMVPIIIRVFFNSNLALLVHLVTILIIGFLVPNSFEFVFIQMITGIITIISISRLENRSQFFFTSFLIFITYSLLYFGLVLTQEGKITSEFQTIVTYFAASSLLTLFSYPLIFVFEKIFGYATDVSLMELSNTNTKLLRELASKAPGTFQHSIQVANLVEEVIFEIGGNALLARAGALYHDIGKIEMPLYFIENQTSGINPHNELTYDESAEIIVSHVIKGIKIARKNGIPEQIIDFIRTHHGTKKTEYFYFKQLSEYPNENINESVYTYKGPIPFSKETAVLMIVDSIEAASRSIKNPTQEKISKLVNDVINRQIENNQFLNSNITFRDIDKIKKILIRNLINFYHIRIEYPT